MAGYKVTNLVGTPTDYSMKEHWLALPENPDKPVDLLFLYPSSCMDKKAGTICTIDNKSMRKGAKQYFGQEATAFEPVANLFAPFWRQVNGIKLNQMSFEEVDEAEWAEPRTDVYAALDYYFTESVKQYVGGTGGVISFRRRSSIVTTLSGHIPSNTHHPVHRFRAC